MQSTTSVLRPYGVLVKQNVVNLLLLILAEKKNDFIYLDE